MNILSVSANMTIGEILLQIYSDLGWVILVILKSTIWGLSEKFIG